MWIFLFKQAISFFKSLQCLKCWTITFFPGTSFQISHKATWQTRKMFSKHLAVDSSFTTWKNARNRLLTILLRSHIDYRKVYLCYSSVTQHGTTPYRGWKRKKKIQFPVWIALLLTLYVWPHVRHGPCFCVYILCGKGDKYVTLLLKGLLGRLSKRCWRHTSTLTQTMTYDAPTPQLWLNLNKFDEVSTAPESCGKVHLAQMFILCVYVRVCLATKLSIPKSHI